MVGRHERLGQLRAAKVHRFGRERMQVVGFAFVALQRSKTVLAAGSIFGLTSLFAGNLKQLILAKGVVKNLIFLSRKVFQISLFLIHDLRRLVFGVLMSQLVDRASPADIGVLQIAVVPARIR